MVFLAKEQHVALHVARDSALVVLSVIFLPFSIFITLFATMFNALSIIKLPKRLSRIRNGQQIKVLVTGVGMAKGLFLARCLYSGGCTVIAADFEKHGIPVCGRFSRAVSRFYSLRSPSDCGSLDSYIDQVINIIKSEGIDLWVSCSGVATALEDARLMQKIEAKTSCKALQFNEDATFTLDNKYEFMTATASLGLQVPHWGFLTAPSDADNVVRSCQGDLAGTGPREFILKNVAMDDSTRGALPLLSPDRPKQMSEVLEALDYKHSKWIMQQYILGNEEYCTQALVVNGHVRAFLACPSASILMHYELLDDSSPLYLAMLRFTQAYATGMYARHGNLSGHLSFDFLCLSEPTVDGMNKRLLPIECNPRCHTAVVHFRGSESALTSAYLSVLPREKDTISWPVMPGHFVEPSHEKSYGYYWIAHDLVVLFFLPLFQYLRGSITFESLLGVELKFWQHVLLWKDPTFEWWDPVPWLALNHIYWPGQLLMAAWSRKRWSQINVSTGKMFAM